MAEKLFRNSKFTFIGELVEGKTLISDEKCGEKGWKKKRMSIGIKNNENTQFLFMEDMYHPDINTVNMFDKNGNKFKVKKEETHSEKTMSQLPDWAKITIDLETDFEKKKEYTKLFFKKRNDLKKLDETEDDETKKELQSKIDEYDKQIKELAQNRVEYGTMGDVIEFLGKAITIMKGKKVKVTGKVKCNYYNERNTLRYIPQTIEFVSDDIENKLSVNCDVFYTDESIMDEPEEKKMYINGYLGETISKTDTLIPQQFIINYEKIDETNEQHKKLLDYLKGTFEIEDETKLHKIGVELSVINGAEIVEFDESCLTPKQKMEVDLGFHDINYFRPKGNVYGERIQELRVVTGDYKEYPNGAITVLDKDDLMDLIIKDQKDVTKEDLKKVSEEENKETKEDAEDPQALMRSLFS